ncbi:MAG TPA: glycosyltransferase family 4 protein [Anaerolineae bacterium]|nr:glycosyltransferase family 4 protein [Anaerolineae bacterium]
MHALAIVHDWLNQVGGAEDVLAEMHALYPHAPIYTSIYAPEKMPPAMRDWDIRPNWMNRLPGIHDHHQPYLPLYPLAFVHLDLSSYDVVLSNKSGFCHGVRVREDARHIDYCLTPTRYVWMHDAYLQREGFGKGVALAMKPLLAWLRRWDYEAAQRVTHFIAISTEVQERIRRFYHRESVIIYPPVDTERFRPSGQPPEPFFLVLSRLIPYKRIDLAVRACNIVGCRLIVVGDGRDREALEAIAGPTIEFRGRVSDAEAEDLMARCQAFIFPGLEDFGITPLQAQAAGRPVIAYGAGGALDTVIPGVTGEFFHEQTPEALAELLDTFDSNRYDPAACRANAERFSAERFRRELSDYVQRVAAGQEPPSAYLSDVDRINSTTPQTAANPPTIPTHSLESPQAGKDDRSSVLSLINPGALLL